MNHRVEITIFGTLFGVGILRMNKTMVKSGMDVFGPRKWNRMVNDIALGVQSKKTIKEVEHTIGHRIEIEYQEKGIVMQGHGFGMEVFHAGVFMPCDAVEGKNRTLQPSQVMRDYKSQEMLGVFWGRCDSAMTFRWDDVEHFRQDDLVLKYDSLGEVLVRKRGLDIATGVTLKGKSGRRKVFEPDEDFEIQKHVFHMVN